MNPVSAAGDRDVANHHFGDHDLGQPVSATTTVVPTAGTGKGQGRRRSKSAVSAFLHGELVAERFEILRPLGQGGMGQVFAAADLELGGTLALKVVRPDLAVRPEVVAQLRREVKLARMVTHPNVCRIYDVTQHAERPADGSPPTSMLLLTMELLDGRTLRDRLAEGCLRATDALPLLRQMAAALESAHRVGVVHRDFKPENVVLLEDGADVRAVVTDFGVAALSAAGLPEEDPDSGTVPRIAGTPAYMAPEERLGSSSPAGDLYSFGVVALECLTGRRPALGTSIDSIDVAGLDPEIEALLFRCLAIDPEQRPAATSIVQALDRLVDPAVQGVDVLLQLGPAESAPAAARSAELAAVVAERGGRILSSRDQDLLVAVNGPSYALPLALRLLDRQAEQPAEQRGAGIAIHLGALDAAGIGARDTVSALAAVARPGQILLSRNASELIRESGRPPVALLWTSHGLYALPGLTLPVEIFEVATRDSGPCGPPRESESVRKVLSPATIFGWRPAVGSELPGRPHWRIVRKLGEGGFGDVWLIAHRKTRERRVLKFCYDRERLASLQREVTLFRFLLEELGTRDDITRVIDWNLDQEPYFIEAEYTAGGNLLDWIESVGGVEAIDPATRRGLVAQVAEALSAAHSVGVLHRDVKPANILVEADRDGEPQIRLTDFGIGHVTDRDRLGAAGITVLGMPHLGDSGSSAGTRLYQAPELVEGRTPSVQADVYALGVLLFQLEAGDLSLSLSAGWERHVDDPLVAEDIADAVDGIPSRRPNAQQLADRLRSLEERRLGREETRRLRAEAAASRLALARGRRRRRIALVVVAALLVVATAMGLLARKASQEARRARDTARAAVAGEWLDRDPTYAALALLEIEKPDETARARSRARELLGRHLAWEEFRGHDGSIGDLVFDAGGEHLVTSGFVDSTVRIWSLTGPRRSLVLRGHTEGIQRLVVSPDGERLLSASPDRTPRIWHIDGRAEPISLRGHEDRVWSGTFSPDGQRVATASADGSARIWDAESGDLLTVLRGHEGWVFHVRFNHDGSLLATASQDGTVRLWPADGSGPVTVLRGHESWVFHVFFADHEQRIISTSRDGTVREWDLDGTPRGIALDALGPIYRTITSADGRWRLTDSAHGAAYLWSADGSREPMVLRGSGGKTRVAIERNGKAFAVGFEDGLIHLYLTDQGTEEPVSVLNGHRGAILSLQFSPDGRWLASGSSDATARLWPVASPPPRHLSSRRSLASSLALVAGGTRLVAGEADGSSMLWQLDDPASGRLLEGHRAEVGAIAATADGAYFATGSVDDTIRLWTADGRFLGRLAGHGDSIVFLAFDPDRGDLISASLEGTMLLWPLRLGELRSPDLSNLEPTPLLTELGYLRSIAIDFERDVAVLVDHSGVLKAYPLAMDGDSVTPPAFEFPDASDHQLVAFNPDDDQIFAGRADGSIAAWRLHRSRQRLSATRIREIAAHSGRVSALAAGCFGNRLVSGAWDGTARAWQADLDAVSTPLELPSEHVTSATCDPGSDLVVVGTSSGAIQTWHLDEPDPLEALKTLTRVCLAPDFRRQVLGESAETARRKRRECESRPASLPSELGPGLR